MTEQKEGRVDRPRAATFIAAAAFIIGTLGAIGFATIYTLGTDDLRGSFTQALGVSLALAVGGIGVGLVTWGHALMPGSPQVEERDFPAPQPHRRKEMLETFEERTGTVGRRSLLGRLLAGALGATGIAALFPLRSLGRQPLPERVRTGWFSGVRVVNEAGEPVRVDELPFGGFLTVFPEQAVDTADSQTILLRIPPDIFRPLAGRERWSPEGYVAYSKVCTHAGCAIGLYQVESQRLICPCHQSAFNALEGARPIFGPAARSLPQLPLAVDQDGFLVAAGDFDKPMGAGFWTYWSHTDDEGGPGEEGSPP